MMTMKNWAARSMMSAPEIATAMAITSSCAPRSRQSSLSRTFRTRRLEQPVADPPHRLDVPRADGIVAQLLPQLAHVHVDRPIDDRDLVERVDVRQQLFAGEHAAGKLHQRLQQLVLDHREAHFPTADEDLVPLEIHEQIASDDPRRGGPAGTGPPQNGVDPGD